LHKSWLLRLIRVLITPIPVDLRYIRVPPFLRQLKRAASLHAVPEGEQMSKIEGLIASR
jgi:hypothetical protein